MMFGVVLPSVTVLELFSLGFTGFNRSLLGFIGFCWIVLVANEFLLFNRFLRCLMWFYSVLLGFYQIWLCFTGFDWVLPSFTGFFYVKPSFTGLESDGPAAISFSNENHRGDLDRCFLH